ncbi:MAG: cell division protein ZapA [Muribaculaceae bacterium]|nr:cell division protein ZapA [Muribaculaceae bacterium]
MKDKLNITIRIAEVAPIPLSINMKDEEVIRTAEYNVNQLYTAWKQRFKDKKRDEILAMVAFQFAKLYQNQAKTDADNLKSLQELEEQLSAMLKDENAD